MKNERAFLFLSCRISSTSISRLKKSTFVVWCFRWPFIYQPKNKFIIQNSSTDRAAVMPLEQWIPSINTDFAVSDDGLGSLYGNMSKIFSHSFHFHSAHSYCFHYELFNGHDETTHPVKMVMITSFFRLS